MKDARPRPLVQQSAFYIHSLSVKPYLSFLPSVHFSPYIEILRPIDCASWTNDRNFLCLVQFHRYMKNASSSTSLSSFS